MKCILSLFLGLFLIPLSMAGITEALSQLSSDNYDVRTEGRNELLSLFAEATAPGNEAGELPGMLAEVASATQKDLPIPSRLYLIKTLGLFGTDTSVKPLVLLLDDESPKIRDNAMQAIARIGTDQAVAALVQRLGKAPESERRGLLLALSSSNNETAILTIGRLLHDSDPVLTNLAATALGKMSVEKAIPILLELRNSAPVDQRLVFESALLDIGLNKDIVSDFLQNGSNDSIRVAAYRQLIEMDISAAANFLQSIIGREDAPAHYGFIASAASSNIPQLYKVLTDNIDKLSANDRVLMASAIGDNRASHYEDLLLSFLNDESIDVRLATIDALGWIGTNKSFDAIYAQYLSDKNNDRVRDALTRLNAAAFDQLLIRVLENSGDPIEMIAVVELIALRNTPGTNELISSIATSTDRDPDLRKACLKALETIGNTDSVKLMLGLILAQSDMTRPAQTSLKRLSQNLGNPHKLWLDAYQPALATASSDDQIKDILLILDGVPTQETLDYMLSACAKPQLKQAVLRTLPRWTDYNVALTWLELANSDSSTAEDKATALAGLKRALTHESMKGDIRTKAQVAKQAVLKAKTPEQKLLILNAFKDAGLSNKDKSIVSKEFESLKSDEDVSELLSELIATP